MSYRSLYAFLPAIGLIILNYSCQNTPSGPSGYELALTHCSSCHAFPEPELLDKITWQNHVLPRMGYFMGIYEGPQIRKGLMEEGPAGETVSQANVFPASPTIDTTVFLQIKTYYLQNAPDKLPSPANPKPADELTLFQPKVSDYRLSPPSSTLVQVAPSGGFYLGDAHTKALYFFDKKLQLQKAATLKEAPVWLQTVGQTQFITLMGSFSPTDAPSGSYVSLAQNLQLILPSLQRPVHSQLADFDGDKNADILVCAFGKWTGSLSWYQNLGNGGYQKHILRDKPGAIKAYIRDFNQDKQPDVIALFGQGDEGIFIYHNEGNGQFREERLLTFPASYGSSFFDLLDYDNDGDEDILYTCGDNADYPALLKPYHGIRVFLNDGTNHFSEHFFYPMHGAYKAITLDFDQDGDKDIAAIAFFPDFQRTPEQGFVYLQNNGANNFQPFTFKDAKRGRWIVMDAGDIDIDGDIDLVLGSLAFEVVPANDLLKTWVEEGIPFMVLENRKVEGGR